MRLLQLLSLFALLLTAAIAQNAPTADAPPAFEFKDGDRIAFIGDTFMERENAYGEIELRLTLANPDKKLIFRNLGWSADTPLGESRAFFDPPEKGFDRLKETVKLIKPTVVFLSHGMSASFAGEAGLPKFKADMTTLIAAIEEICKPESVRFVILGPIPHETIGGRFPKGDAHNETLRLYDNALKEIATEKKARFIGLFDRFRNEPKPRGEYHTDNGIHLNAFGYRRAAEQIAQILGVPMNAWRVSITEEGKVRDGVYGIETEEIVRTDKSVKFRAKLKNLPLPPLEGVTAPNTYGSSAPFVQLRGLAPGNYSVSIDGFVYATYTHSEWNRAMLFHVGPFYHQAETLRQTILRKNELFFHRWRPQNETYLFGFRKHEQGQNAREIPMFDPLITAEEEKIAKLNSPQWHTFEAKEDFVTQTMGLVTPPKRAAHPSSEGLSAKRTQPLPQFEVAEGFEVSLWAENPQLAKPIQMNFDPRGRLWVASSAVYPQIEPGQKADDKIIIIEDSDHDGKADKSTVFAEGLLIPTGVEPGDGGVYVGQSTELLHFKDTDGDGVADERKTVLAGFGTEDTHHILHTLRWGHDGSLYMNQSVYIHSHIETPHGVVRLNSGGILNFRPDTHQLSIHMRGLWNSWGHHFDRFGQSFATDGAGNQGIHYVFPGATFVAYAGARRVLESISPGSYPKFCGLEIIESEHFPADWQGQVVTADFRAHRVVRFAVNEKDSSYLTKEMPDLLRTTNVTFRPIDVKLGPDGALYIADWSNPIIQHGEVDFRDPRRDHEHGRIWRVTAKGKPTLKPIDFTKLSRPELFEQLLSPNNYNRQRARRVLTEQGSVVVNEIATWAQGKGTDQARLEALWILQSINEPYPALLNSILASTDGRIRAAGVRVLSAWSAGISDAQERLAKLALDEHPRVRLEAVRALGQFKTIQAVDSSLAALGKPMDSFLDYALWLTMNELAPVWVHALKDGSWKIEGREKQLEFGLKAIEPALAGQALGTLIAGKPLPRDGSGPWIDLIGKAGATADLNKLYQQILSNGFDDGAATRGLAALSEAARVRNTTPGENLAGVSALLKHGNADVQARAVQLAGQWKLPSALQDAVALVAAEGTSAAVRQAAFQAIRDLGNRDAVPELKKLATAERPAAVRNPAVITLASLNQREGAAAAADVLAATQDENEAVQLWRSLLTIRGMAAPLARALPASGLSAPVARAGMRVAREGGRNEADLVLALARNLDSAGEVQELTPAEMQTLAGRVSKEGNAARGEHVYRRQELACMSCHAIGGIGGKVGPDLTSMGASAQVDYIIESLLFPNRKIKEGYHSIAIETNDGESLSGILVRETTDQLFIRDSANNEVAIAKNKIKDRQLGGSLMPAGLIDPLSEQERLDLVRFLSELGKPGRYDASRGNVARFWKVAAAASEMAQFGEGNITVEALKNNTWVPSITLVDGALGKAQLQAGIQRMAWRQPTAVYAVTRFQVAKDGPVRLRVENLPKAAAWLDGKPIEVANEIRADATAGAHTLVLKIDADKFPEQLTVRSDDATFLTDF